MEKQRLFRIEPKFRGDSSFRVVKADSAKEALENFGGNQGYNVRECDAFECGEDGVPFSRRAKVTAEYKIGQNKGRPRIWIDGKKLKDAGFVGGVTYFYEVWSGKIICALNQKDAPSGPAKPRKVTGRPDGKPIIDMLGGDVKAAFPDGQRVKVTFEPGKLTIERAT